MKAIPILLAILLTATMLFGQGNYFNTSSYSSMLDMEKKLIVWHFLATKKIRSFIIR